MELKAGLFVDASNLYRKDGPSLNYRALRSAASERYDLLHCNVYVAIDPENPKPVKGFMAALRDIGFKVIGKEWSRNANGFISAGLDMELAIDVLTQSSQLDVVFLVTGDPDFTRLVRAMQSRGKRVEVMAFQDRISTALRQEADAYHALETLENIFMEEPEKPQPDTNESPALQKLEERQSRTRSAFRR
ncbi:NYN domain-containing protein [Gemmatimonadota bacterium]